MRLPRLTSTRAMVASLTLTGILVGALVWVMLAAWQRSILATAAQQQAAATRRAAVSVEQYLGHLRRVVADIERRHAAGICALSDGPSTRSCLLGQVVADEALAEVTFTSATGWQQSAYRDAAGQPHTMEAHADRTHDPRAHLTYATPAAPQWAGKLLWSDLSYSALDADKPVGERRVVVNVLKALRYQDQLLGVLRVALLEEELDRAFSRMRVNDGDPADPFRLFLADGDGRLVTRWRPSDRLHTTDDDLRIAPEDVPAPVAQALARLAASDADDMPPSTMVGRDGRRYAVSFAALPGTQDWRVGVLGPEDYYLARPRHVRRWVTMAAIPVLALIGLLLGLATAATRRGLRRVVAESERMRRFEFTSAPCESAFADVTAVLVELERAKTALRGLSRYAPVDLVRQLYAANREPMLGGELRELTLLFTDIEGFTSFAETMPPERLAQLLGHYFAVMTKAVGEEGGTVDKYIGDALMVLWNAPVAQPDHAERACRAALACVQASAQLFASPVWRGVPPLNTRFGIHCDTVMVGHFGAPERFAYTAIGDGVNLASRLEGLNKEYGTSILVSGAVAERVRNRFELRQIDRVAVKGKAQGVDIYELLGAVGEASRMAPARQYETALTAYFARDFARAAEILQAQLDHDPPSRVLHRRCLALHATPPAPTWQGVHAWTTK
jgi:adenylate cyclase